MSEKEIVSILGEDGGPQGAMFDRALKRVARRPEVGGKPAGSESRFWVTADQNGMAEVSFVRDGNGGRVARVIEVIRFGEGTGPAVRPPPTGK